MGMYNQGNVAIGKKCTDSEYRMQFSMWCLAGVPLFIGTDIRQINSAMHDLLLNKELIKINQDKECRPPFLVSKRSVFVKRKYSEDAVEPLTVVKDQLYTFIKHLENNEFIIAYFNMFEEERDITCIFADAGIPYSSGYGFEMKDVFSNENIGIIRDYHITPASGHDCKIFRCRLVKYYE